MKSKVLIFGSSGFLGRQITPLLNNFELVCCDVDITNRKELHATIKGHNPELIINCSGCINYSVAAAREVLAVNFSGLMNILEIFNKNIVSIGSIAAFDSFDNIYAYSKKIAEDLTHFFDNLHIVRFPGLYSSWRDNGAIYNIYQRAVEHEDIIIDSHLARWNCFKLETAARTLVMNLEEILSQKISNIGYAEPHNITTVAHILRDNVLSDSKINILNDAELFSLSNLEGFIPTENALGDDLIGYVKEKAELKGC